MCCFDEVLFVSERGADLDNGDKNVNSEKACRILKDGIDYFISRLFVSAYNEEVENPFETGKRIMRKLLLKTVSITLSILIVLSGVPLLAASANTSQGVYELNISEVDQQTVKGWGIFPSWNRADWNRDFIGRTGAHQALFNDLGATLFRVILPTVAGDGSGNLIDAKMQEVYELIAIGEEREMHDYIMSVWSPPVGMKTHPTVNGWTGSEHVRLRTDKEDAYTTYLVRAIQWLAVKGASVPKAISFQNEPLSQIISEWCYWGGDNGTQYQRVAKLLRSKLDAAELADVQILGPEGAAYYENELLLGQDFSALSNDTELYNAIDGLASHSYFARGYDNNDSYKAYTKVLDLFPEKDKWQTEYSSLIANVSDMDMAINAARRLAGDMALMQNNYWFWWLGWANGRHPADHGEVLLDGDGFTVTKSKAFYVLSHIFNNVSVGSKVRRISADPASGLVTSDAVWMDAVAFVDGTKTVALLVNSTDQSKTVNVNGLTGTTASVYQLTSSVTLGEDMKLAASRNIQEGTASVIDLPTKSVSVIVTSDTDTAPPHITFDQSSSSASLDASYAVRDSEFIVSGHLDEEGTLLINGETVVVASDLSFSTTVTLQSGDNVITAVATDTLNNLGDPVPLFIRFNPSYLGVSLDQSSLSYVNQSAFTVSGNTNGSATVNLKQEHGGLTLMEATYNVGAADGGGPPTVDTLRKIFDDNYVSTVYNLTDALGGFTTAGAQIVRDSSSTLATAEGAYSARLKLQPGFSRIGFTLVNASNHAVLENYSSSYPTAGLQFWVYTRTKEDSFSAVLESDNNGTAVEARVPLNNYLTSSDYGEKWVQVTIPLSAFDTATHYDADGQVTDLPIMWNTIRGVGFSKDTAGYYSPNVDDVKIVSVSGPTSPSTPLTFSAELNLQVGDNSVTAEVYNSLGQHAVPATIHVIYDPNPPVLTVPSEGATSGTSYVLNGSVNEEAVITVNGIETALKPDRSFTAVVPVAKGLNAITVVAEDAAGNISQAVVTVNSDPVDDGALTPGVAAANYTSTAPIIDGELTETGWSINNRVEKMITGTSDNNLTFGTMWDTNNLYVAVKVLDADLINDSEPAQTYQDDSVEIYIDGNNSRSSTYGTDDHQITLGWHDEQLSVGGDIAGIAFAQKDIAGGFVVEFSIPWSGIGIDPPTAVSVIGLDIAYNDDDGNNSGNRESQLMWRGNGDNWRSTTAFGSLILNDGKNVTVALEPSGALTVDGALDEPYWALRSHVTKNITGTSNNSVRFGTLSDIQNLYVGIEVLDAELRNDSTLAYQDDSVEIYLDVDHNQSAAYDAKDHQITLRWHDELISMIGELANVQFAQKDINGGYTVELAIPWTSLNRTPARDITLGLDIGINDDDGQNDGNRESQQMWNGTADNWRNTSAFGNLLIHNLSLSLSDNSEPDPDGLVEFTDNAGDLTKLYDKTAKIINASGHPENFSGDADRIAHNIDNPTSPEYVVYRSPEGDIYSFDVVTGLFSNTPQFSFYGSADGVNYTKITAASTLTGGANGYAVFSNTANKLTAGIKYLKIEFPGLENWKEQLLNVSFKYYGESTTPPVDPHAATFTDEAGDLSKLHDKSAHIGNALGGDVVKYAGDGNRFIHTNDDSIEPEYIVYKSPDGDIQSFDINVTNWTGLPSSAAFEIYSSADGTSFTKLLVNPVMLSTSSGYNTLSIKADSIASGSKYLKIIFPYGDAINDNWTSTINKVTFTYGVTGTDPVEGPVSATAVLTGQPLVAAGQTFELTFGLADVEGSIVAEDLKVVYDPEVFEFVSIDELKDGFSVMGQTQNEGIQHLILASTGIVNAVINDGELLKFSFKAKSAVQAGISSISITDNVITNMDGVESQVQEAMHTIQIAAVDKSVLIGLVTDTQSQYAAAVEGTQAGQYPAGSKAVLLSAIQTAQAIVESSVVTQQQVDEAVQTLQTAILATQVVIQLGDVNGDGKISIGDLGLVIGYYGKHATDSDWDKYKRADINLDGMIDIVDMAMIANRILE
jgi:O-glycosyl hydrolase